MRGCARSCDVLLDDLQSLITTVWLLLPSLFNFLSLLFLVFFIFAVLGE
jgi:hypothetical protein